MTTPDAMKLLTDKVNEIGQAKVGRMLGYTSRAIVSQVLSGTYPAGTDTFMSKVIEVFGGLSVECPEMRGEITLAECAGHRRRKPTSDSFYASMYKACKHCEKNQFEVQGSRFKVFNHEPKATNVEPN